MWALLSGQCINNETLRVFVIMAYIRYCNILEMKEMDDIYSLFCYFMWALTGIFFFWKKE